jgi:phage gp45-like
MGDRWKSMISYGKLLLSYPGQPQQVQVEGTTGTVRDKVQHVQPYGVSVNPLPGAEAVTINIGGDAAQSLCIVVADRRYVLMLEPGETALHDDQGQSVKIARDGIEITTTKKVVINSPEVFIAGKINLSGEVKINGITQVWD